MKKWYELQFVIMVAIIVLLFTFTLCGEVLSGKFFRYKTETFTIAIGLLVISGVIRFLAEVFKKDDA